MKNLLSTLLLTLTVVGAAQAYPGQNIDHRQNNQQRRIYQGVRSGQLTPREARHLERREAKLNYQEARARQNGLTWQERQRLERKENHLSRDIYRQKHDRQNWR